MGNLGAPGLPTPTIYTPGSDAGVPLNVVGSLAAPPLSWDTEAEALRDEIEGTVMSILGLIGIEADSLASREFVLVEAVFGLKCLVVPSPASGAPMVVPAASE